MLNRINARERRHLGRIKEMNCAEFWRQIERTQKRVKSKAPEVRDMSEV